MAEFASNASASASTETTPFAANYGFEPRMSFDPIDDMDQGTARERVSKRKVAAITENMLKTWDFIKQKLAKSQDSQKHQADKKRTPSPEYRVGDMV